MNKLIIISSTQYPGYGGAATNCYALIKFLRKNGYNVIGLFFYELSVDVDPDNIGNIFLLKTMAFEKNDIGYINSYLDLFNKNFPKPDFMLCKNYKAPQYCRTLFPDVKNIYLVSGISHFSLFFPNMSAQDFLKNDIEIPIFASELQTIKDCDLVVVNSSITYDLIQKIYPEYIKKIYPFPIDTTKEIKSLLNLNDININHKYYDFIIVASNLKRTDKNNIFLIKILCDVRFNKYKKLIIGQNNQLFAVIPNSTLLNLLPHKKVMEYMKKSKILLYPSLTDANPNTVREAIHNKCIPLISNNIGYNENFPKYSVCTTFSHDEWSNKALYLINNYDSLIMSHNIKFTTNENIVSFIEKFI